MGANEGGGAVGVYGPFNASLNTVVQVTGIDVNADRVFVDNQSKYTLAIGFTPTQPTAVVTLYGHPWYGQVPPGGKTITIPRSAYNEQFPGYFWVLALDPLSATRAYTGIISANTAFFVQALLPGEPSPPDYAIPQATDLASQPRVISLQVPPDKTITVDSAFPAAANYFANGTQMVLSTGPFPSQQMMIFIPYWHFSTSATGAAAGDYVVVSLVARQLDGSGTEIINTIVLRAIQYWQAPPFQPPLGPSGVIITQVPQVNLATLELRMFNHFIQGAGTWTIKAGWGGGVDTTSNKRIPGYGLGNTFGNQQSPW